MRLFVAPASVFGTLDWRLVVVAVVAAVGTVVPLGSGSGLVFAFEVGVVVAGRVAVACSLVHVGGSG